eukprot:4418050-Amphidinium_carterae.7
MHTCYGMQNKSRSRWPGAYTAMRQKTDGQKSSCMGFWLGHERPKYVHHAMVAKQMQSNTRVSCRQLVGRCERRSA